MKNRNIALATVLGAAMLSTAVAAPAFAAETAPAVASAKINFASKSIRSWKAGENDKVIYVQHDNRDWYRVDLLSPCPGMKYSSAVGFDFGPTDSFDKFSAVTVDEQYCRVVALTKLDAEPTLVE